MCNFSIATTDKWKDKGGEQQERTEWHRISTFSKLAEICGEYLKKGSQVYIEGRLQTRKWQDKEGNEKFSTEIVASDMQMLGGRGGAGGSASGAERSGSNYGSGGSAEGANPRNDSAPRGQAEPPMDFDDDIPF